MDNLNFYLDEAPEEYHPNLTQFVKDYLDHTKRHHAQEYDLTNHGPPNDLVLTLLKSPGNTPKVTYKFKNGKAKNLPNDLQKVCKELSNLKNRGEFAVGGRGGKRSATAITAIVPAPAPAPSPAMLFACKVCNGKKDTKVAKCKAPCPGGKVSEKAEDDEDEDDEDEDDEDADEIDWGVVQKHGKEQMKHENLEDKVEELFKMKHPGGVKAMLTADPASRVAMLADLDAAQEEAKKTSKQALYEAAEAAVKALAAALLDDKARPAKKRKQRKP
jgi:hypothetical protein